MPNLAQGNEFRMVAPRGSVNAAYVVHLRLTGIATNNDLTWTATAWQDGDA